LASATRAELAGPKLVVNTLAMSDQDAIPEDSTIRAKDTSINPVTRPLNQITSPYAYFQKFVSPLSYMCTVTHNDYYSKILEDSIDGDAKVLLLKWSIRINLGDNT
jgi:hypothetical protein